MSGREPDGDGFVPDLSSLLSNLTSDPGDGAPESDPTFTESSTSVGINRVHGGDESPHGSDSGSGSLADGTGDLRQLPVDSIVPNEYQPRRRFDEEAMVSLTDSVKALGVLQPVLVRPTGSNRFELIAGERRWRAARRAGLAEIPAIIRTPDDRGTLEQAIVENLHRADLNAIEEAAAYQQLIEDFGLSQDDVAARVGKSRSAVSNTLRLFQLPGVVQRQVANGELGAGHARAILGLFDPQRQREVAERVIGEGLSVRQVEELVKADGLEPRDGGAPRNRSSSSPKKSVTALEVERLLADRLATRVEVVESGGGGRLVVRFADREDLGRIFDLLGGDESL